jgi:hypothetical protein
VRVLAGPHAGDTGMVVRVDPDLTYLLSDTSREELRVFPRWGGEEGWGEVLSSRTLLGEGGDGLLGGVKWVVTGRAARRRGGQSAFGRLCGWSVLRGPCVWVHACDPGHRAHAVRSPLGSSVTCHSPRTLHLRVALPRSDLTESELVAALRACSCT